MIGSRKQIAIIGSGISGLTAAYRLADRYDITVYEKNDWVGGHTHTVDVELDGIKYAIDTGFIVFNEWTYPRFLNLLSELGLKYQNSNMSFSVTCLDSGVEYAGNNLTTLFAQRHRLLSPAYWRFLLDIIKFNRCALNDLESEELPKDLILGDYLNTFRFGKLFQSHYLKPMAAAIWSSSLDDVRLMPALFFIRFFKNHGLLSITKRPQWYTVPGGSRAYIAPLTETFKNSIHLKTEVTSVLRLDASVEVTSNEGQKTFDGCILASHSDQSLGLLDESEHVLNALLGRIPYSPNDVVLHTDRDQMPCLTSAWASWNYRLGQDLNKSGAVVTYDMNRLQNLSGPHQFFVTLNDTVHIDPAKILGQWTYNHPQFGPESLDIGARIEASNVNSRIAVCGAWCRNGFHEDGVVSGERAARALDATLSGDSC